VTLLTEKRRVLAWHQAAKPCPDLTVDRVKEESMPQRSAPRDTYSTGVLSHDVPTEHQRLRLMEKMADPGTIRLLESLRVGPSWRCLELAAGAGSIARWLAGQCPQGHVVAADIDTRFLDSSWAPNLEVCQFDVLRDGFDRGSFDLIHARALMLHLPDREEILARVATWLAPGGVILIEDTDLFPSQSSPHPAWRRTAQGLHDLLVLQGTDNTWPRRRLPAVLAEIGLSDLGLEINLHPVGSGGPGDEFWPLFLGQLRPEIIRHQILTEEQIAEAITMIDDPTFVNTPFAFVSDWARRPTLPR
jgi:SAM-dependent methyltransferase